MTRPALPDPRFARFNQTAAGIDFAYLAGGQGPPVLLLHGWPLTSWSWRKILAPLADAGFTVIAPDLPGLGESGPAPEGYEKRTLVEPLRASLRALGHNRMNLVGHDMGAPIAYAWARLYPHEVERLARGGATSVMECVGAAESLKDTISIARPGGTVGYVGVPHHAEAFNFQPMFLKNVSLRGGVAPVRPYIPALLADVLAGVIDPAPVLDLTLSLAEVPAGYAAMDARRATKVLVQVA
jgi:pimeloyl-ACP methyl ester carboxylesterase